MHTLFLLVWINLLSVVMMAQRTIMPSYLKGTWYSEETDSYEHWDLIHENSMRGVSYRLIDGKIQVSEYLELSLSKKKLTYKATVMGQNQGQSVTFTMVRGDSVYVFENRKHDFPKRIEYKKIGESGLKATVSDGQSKSFVVDMKKVDKAGQQPENTTQNPNYDAELAAKLGGDERGMKGFTFVILKTGPNTSTDQDYLKKCFGDHMANIKKLVGENKLVVAGPLQKNDKTYRGIFIFNTTNQEEAKVWMEPDTAIREGVLEAEIYGWYGSAALPEYLHAADKIWKTKF